MKTPVLLTLSQTHFPNAYFTPTAKERRDQLIARATQGKTISNALSAEAAAAILRELKEFTRAVEESRKAVKEGPLTLCREIDTLADNLTKQIEGEALRIAQLLGTWQREQKRIADEAMRKAREAEEKLIREAEEKAREEAKKVQAERDALIAQATAANTAKKAAAIEERIQALNAQAEEASGAHVAEVERKIVETRVAVAGKMPPTPAGIATREETKFEITDIVKLYEAAPFLVTLTPNTAAIKSAIKGLTAGQSLPGVRHWKEARAIVAA